MDTTTTTSTQPNKQNNVLNAIRHIESLTSLTMTIKEVESMMAQYDKDLIIKFIIMDKIRELSSPQTSKIYDLFSRVSNMKNNSCEYKERIARQQTNLPLIELLKMLHKAPLSSELYTQEMKDVAKTINMNGYSIQTVYSLLKALVFAKENRCFSNNKRGAMSGKEFVALAEPLRSIENPSTADLYHMIQKLSNHRGINADCDLGLLAESQDLFDDWLNDHPFIAKYLDPYYVMVETINITDAYPEQTIQDQLDQLVDIHWEMAEDDAADPFNGLYICQSRHHAYAVAAAIRTAHSNGHQGGGPGTPLRIAVIQTNTNHTNL